MHPRRHGMSDVSQRREIPALLGRKRDTCGSVDDNAAISQVVNLFNHLYLHGPRVYMIREH